MATIADERQTLILNPTINRIIALSDIHSDLHAFIICLRDCAQVIRKRNGVHHDPNNLDTDTEFFLELNLNASNHIHRYRDDLNYEWIGENTHVVICGDILDGARLNGIIESIVDKRSAPINSRCHPNHCKNLEYDQVEVKLIRFINEMNRQAQIHNGRVIKILGNHDIANLTVNNNLAKYIPEFTSRQPDYMIEDGITYTRLQYFKYGNPGSRLLLQDNAYLLIIINNNIFVHGQLVHNKTFENYITINNNINNPVNNPIYNNPIHRERSIFWDNLSSFDNEYSLYDTLTSNKYIMG